MFYHKTPSNPPETIFRGSAAERCSLEASSAYIRSYDRIPPNYFSCRRSKTFFCLFVCPTPTWILWCMIPGHVWYPTSSIITNRSSPSNSKTPVCISLHCTNYTRPDHLTTTRYDRCVVLRARGRKEPPTERNGLPSVASVLARRRKKKKRNPVPPAGLKLLHCTASI